MPPPIVAFKNRLGSLLQDPALIDLSQAVPSHAPPDVVREAMAQASQDVATARYTNDEGLDALREAIAADLRARHGATIDAAHVLVTPGANAAFHFAANVLLDVGETAFLASPYYFNHAMSVELLGARVEEIRLPLDRAGALDPITPGALFVLVNPSNPTGRTMPRADLERLAAWARRHDVRLLVDETYLEFFPDDETPITATALEEWEETAIVVGSFSKSLAITGYRIGYIAAAPRLIEELVKVQDAAAVCASHPAQRAVLAGLTWSAQREWLAARRREINERVTSFVTSLSQHDSAFHIESAGAFFAYLRTGERHPPTTSKPPAIGYDGGFALAERLAREAGVLLLPGSPFGRSEGRCLRVSVGNVAPERLIEAARRLATWRE